MKPVVERFIAGEDGMATLLRALPAHAPPASMQAWFAQAARQADLARSAAGSGSGSGSAQDPGTLQFEPPASMNAVFAAAAAQAEQAQAAQRAAIQARMSDGEDAAQALGAPLHDTTRAWLQQHTPSPPTAAMPVAPVLQGRVGDQTPAGDGTAPAGVQQAANRASSDSSPRTASLAPPQAAATPSFTSPAAAPSGAAPPRAALHGHAPGRARRQRWMPAVALAASVTLVVGVGLRWQATAPQQAPADAYEPAPASAQVEAEAGATATAADGKQPATGQRLPAPPDQSEAVERMPQPAPSPMAAPPPMPAPAAVAESPPMPAPASRAAPIGIAPPSPAAPAAAPAIAPPPAAALAPPALPAPPAPIASTTVEQRQSSSTDGVAPASMADGTLASPRTATPQAAPMPVGTRSNAASAVDVQRSQAMDANTLVSSAQHGATTPQALQDARPLSLQAPHERSPVPKAAAQPGAPEDAKASATAKPAAPAGTSTTAAIESSVSTPGTSTQLVTLSAPPDAWVDQYLHTHPGAPARLRIWTGEPEATAFRQWLDRLRAAARQHDWSTPVDVIREPRLPPDRVRIEVISTAQP
ncbi:hypothetical protein NC00_18240 [Xanthomonas cannabis pv. phaseoli]|uniref:Uncharacterized protein n=1 Tax=Xanthomonas cannabis pv. phaseoli TaxID=1885902 RepID=A0AB34P3W8_9XANT|nr:hypothetical protein [Xanthomonas cannabis]KGK56316.1 hypothetical protein NC00_18240 [Xanthomonas cannabis pv. phaseoli]